MNDEQSENQSAKLQDSACKLFSVFPLLSFSIHVLISLFRAKYRAIQNPTIKLNIVIDQRRGKYEWSVTSNADRLFFTRYFLIFRSSPFKKKQTTRMHRKTGKKIGNNWSPIIKQLRNLNGNIRLIIITNEKWRIFRFEPCIIFDSFKFFRYFNFFTV